MLQRGDKYAVLAVVNVAVEGAPVIYSDRVAALSETPVSIGEHWTEWLGTIVAEQLSNATLFLLSRRPSSTPGIVDGELRELQADVVYLWRAVLLDGIPYTEGAHILSGGWPDDRPDVRQHVEDDEVRQSFEDGHARIGRVTLRAAHERAAGLKELHSRAPRVFKGFRSLLRAIRERFLDDRVHDYVRALDGPIATEQGRGERHFVERCLSILVTDSAANRETLQDIYRLRNVVEHHGDWEHVVARFPADDREEAANRRVRQVETMALKVFRELADSSGRRDLFRDESALRAFWALPAEERARLWHATPIDLQSIR